MDDKNKPKIEYTEFRKLLDLQRQHIKISTDIRQIAKVDQMLQVAQDIEAVKAEENQEKDLKIQKDIDDNIKKLVKVAKESLALSIQDTRAITTMAQEMETFKTFGDRIKDLRSNINSKFGSFSALKTTVLKATNVGGIFNKAIAKEGFIQQQKMLGSEKSRSELGEDFKNAQAVSKDIKSNEAEIAKVKKETGLNEEQLSKTKFGQNLLEKRKSLASDYDKYDIRSSLVREDTNEEKIQKVTKTIEPIQKSDYSMIVGPNGQPLIKSGSMTNNSSSQFADQNNLSEEEIESLRVEQQQTSLLETIAKNTDPKEGTTSSESSGGGGGILAGLGAGLGALGKGIGVLGKGIGVGLKSALTGLALGLKSIANPATLVGLGALTVAALGLGKALELAAPGILAFGEAAEKIFGAIFGGIVDIIKEVTNSIEKLSQIDGGNLLKVGAGLVGIAGGLVAFSAANVVAGITNVVSGLLSIIPGVKSPIEQLEQISKFGPDLEKAGVGVEKLGNGLKAFSSVDMDKIKAIAALPTDKIAAMGAAMGQANTVYNQSANNAGAAVASGGGQNTVVAPTITNNTTRTANVIKLPPRNTDNTVNSYFRSRYATQ